MGLSSLPDQAAKTNKDNVSLHDSAVIGGLFLYFILIYCFGVNMKLVPDVTLFHCLSSSLSLPLSLTLLPHNGCPSEVFCEWGSSLLKLQYVTFWATQPNSHRNMCL
jgi:hypothetical protein